MADDGPPIIRPIPRRPFNINFTSATPPDQGSSPASPSLPDFINARFLQPTPEAASLSRPQSVLNLTSSTLSGIYTPTTGHIFSDQEELDTPWGTGAQTPIRRPSIDDVTYEFMRDRSHGIRRRSSILTAEPPNLTASTPSYMSLALRGLLLFCLGVGYGVLVTTTRFRTQSGKMSSFTEGGSRPPYHSVHLFSWGLAGVILGVLLPWFDRVWEESVGETQENVPVAEGDDAGPTKDPGPSTDWALVIRAVGAFVGILFAIRKVAWVSTLQVSLSLALVNPLLWWLIDRSKPGLVLSTAVGFAGSVLLLGVNPEIMPAPSGVQFGNSSSSQASSSLDDLLTFGGLARPHTVEAGVWMLSVLFCSCVCFGNIGRRLAMGRPGAVKGRWAGIQ
ncbi:insulin-induced protein-domain-containing protein [Mariannaea sp. PMI_226]|nr:insulin-induced protein-domain-containing protein [Mariannaea sp. PMI_226]